MMISIVIPIYNAERFLQDCVESVIKQTYADFELLLVNDGSSDGSLELCKKFAEQDTRIRVIDRPNGGVSCARNSGLEAASGEYVLFVDADDLIHPAMLEKLNAVTDGAKVDTVICGFTVTGQGGPYSDIALLRENAGEITKQKLLPQMISMRLNRIRENVWRCLFRREMLLQNKITFPTGVKIAEDYLFFINAVVASGKIVILPEELYVYRMNDGSATAKYIDTLYADMTRLDNRIFELCKEHPELSDGYTERRTLTYIRSLQNMCLQQSPYSLKEAIHLAKKMRREEGFVAHIKSMYRNRRALSKQDKLSVFMLRHGWVGLYLRLYAFYKKRSADRPKN